MDKSNHIEEIEDIEEIEENPPMHRPTITSFKNDDMYMFEELYNSKKENFDKNTDKFFKLLEKTGTKMFSINYLNHIIENI